MSLGWGGSDWEDGGGQAGPCMDRCMGWCMGWCMVHGACHGAWHGGCVDDVVMVWVMCWGAGKIPIRPPLTEGHKDYMILLLYDKILTFYTNDSR